MRDDSLHRKAGGLLKHRNESFGFNDPPRPGGLRQKNKSLYIGAGTLPCLLLPFVLWSFFTVNDDDSIPEIDTTGSRLGTREGKA